MRFLLSLLILMSVSIAEAKVDLKAINIDFNDIQCKVKKQVIRQRSLDIWCDQKATKALLSSRKYKGVTYSVLDQDKFLEESGASRWDSYYIVDALSDLSEAKREYRSYKRYGKLIGYRYTSVHVNEDKGTKVIVGLKYNREGKLAKIYILDRSERKVDMDTVPQDLKEIKNYFDSAVISPKDQDEYEFFADVITLPGQSVDYASAIMLQHTMNTAIPSGIEIYDLSFKAMSNADEISKVLYKDYGFFCSNFKKPGSDEGYDWDDNPNCISDLKKLLEKILSVNKEVYVIYTEMDETEEGYILIPSKDDEEKFMRIFFDISHNV